MFEIIFVECNSMRKISYDTTILCFPTSTFNISSFSVFFMCVCWVAEIILITFQKWNQIMWNGSMRSHLYTQSGQAHQKVAKFRTLYDCREVIHTPRHAFTTIVLSANTLCETRLYWEKNLAHAKKLGYSRFKLIAHYAHDIFKNPCKNVQKSYSM